MIEAQSPNLTAIMAAFGATPEFVGMEAPDAIAKGVLDGTLTNWPAMVVFGFADVCNYSTDCALAGPIQFAHVMNLDTWDSLPPDLQELFVGENAWRLSELYGYQFDQDTMMFRAMLNDMY